MSKKNSLAAKAARREQNAAAKQVNKSDNSKLPKMELPEQVKNPTPETVGIVVELVKKSGDSVPFLFQTDRSEFYEVLEIVNKINDIEEQKSLWFTKIVFTLCEITPIDETFFRSVVFSIAANGVCNKSFEENPNEPVSFGVMIHEGSMGINLTRIAYNVWVEIFEMNQTQKNCKPHILN